MNVHRLPLPRFLALTATLVGPLFSLPPAQAAPVPPAAQFAPNYARVSGMRLLHWAHFPLKVYFAPSGAATDERRKSVLAGFDQWTQATNGVVQYRIIGARARAALAVMLEARASVSTDPGATGSTGVAFSGPVLRKADMQLATGGLAPGDLQSVAAHEFGHALGLNGHSDNPDDLMYPTATRYLTFDLTPVAAPPRAITLRDLNTLKACYPALFAPARRPAH